MPHRPSSTASVKALAVLPMLDTHPKPATATRPLTSRTLPCDPWPFNAARAPLRHVTRRWMAADRQRARDVRGRRMRTGRRPHQPRAHDATDAFDELYERGRPIEATLRTIRARFTETTTSSLLVQPLVAEGTLIVRRPHDVVLRYSKPGREDAAARRDVTAPRLARAIGFGSASDIARRKPRPTVLRRQESRRAAPALHDSRPGRRRRGPATWKIAMVPEARADQAGPGATRSVGPAGHAPAVGDAPDLCRRRRQDDDVRRGRRERTGDRRRLRGPVGLACDPVDSAGGSRAPRAGPRRRDRAGAGVARRGAATGVRRRRPAPAAPERPGGSGVPRFPRAFRQSRRPVHRLRCRGRSRDRRVRGGDLRIRPTPGACPGGLIGRSRARRSVA